MFYNDPTLTFCLPTDSLTQPRTLTPPSVIPYSPFQPTPDQPPLELQLSFSPNPPPPTLLTNPEDFITLNNKKSAVSDKTFKDFRDITNPVPKLNFPNFGNRAADKLIIIDGVFNITNTVWNTLNTQLLTPFTFFDIAGGPGSWSKYIFYRFPNAAGGGLSLKSFEWYSDLNRETYKYGDIFTTNIPENFVNKCDLVIADGGMDGSDFQEQESFKLFLAEASWGLKLLKQGGNLVMKFYSVNTEATAELIYLLSLQFETCYMIKPLASRPANEEQYFVGINYVQDINLLKDIIPKFEKPITSENNEATSESNINLLSELTSQLALGDDRIETTELSLTPTKANKPLTNTEYITHLINYQLPDDFRDFFVTLNDKLLKNQDIAVDNIISASNGTFRNTSEFDVSNLKYRFALN